VGADFQFYPDGQEFHKAQQLGMQRQHRDYLCGACSKPTNGRLVGNCTRLADSARISICVCSCSRCEPTIIVELGGKMLTQLPLAKEFLPGENWPKELTDLFTEASNSYAAGAPTSAAMACRKILMACACEQGDTPDRKFFQYVDYITDEVIKMPKVKPVIEKIKTIGNEANHEIHFVTPQDAARCLSIITYMLNTIYSLPSA
jgi:hypothetical protein